MEKNNSFENSKLEFDEEQVEESAKEHCVLLGDSNPEPSNKQQAVGDKHSRDENNDTNNVEGGSKSQNNVKEKSQIQTRQNKKKTIKSKALSFCKIAKKDVTHTNVEKKVQKKNIRKSVTKQNNDLTCLPSTSSSLPNVCSNKTDVDKIIIGSDDRKLYNTSIKPDCGPSNMNALKTLFPLVGLPYFPDYMKANPVPIRNEIRGTLPGNYGKTQLLMSKMDSLPLERFYQDTNMTPPVDRDFLPFLDDPKSPEPKKRKLENVKEERQYPQPLKGKQHQNTFHKVVDILLVK